MEEKYWGWPKISFGFFHKLLQMNMNEHEHQRTSWPPPILWISGPSISHMCSVSAETGPNDVARPVLNSFSYPGVPTEKGNSTAEAFVPDYALSCAPWCSSF